MHPGPREYPNMDLGGVCGQGESCRRHTLNPEIGLKRGLREPQFVLEVAGSIVLTVYALAMESPVVRKLHIPNAMSGSQEARSLLRLRKRFWAGFLTPLP